MELRLKLSKILRSSNSDFLTIFLSSNLNSSSVPNVGYLFYFPKKYNILTQIIQSQLFFQNIFSKYIEKDFGVAPYVGVAHQILYANHSNVDKTCFYNYFEDLNIRKSLIFCSVPKSKSLNPLKGKYKNGVSSYFGTESVRKAIASIMRHFGNWSLRRRDKI